MAAKTFKMTSAGKAELEKELDYLKTEGRIDIAEKLKVARSYGDFPKTVNMMKLRASRQRLRHVSANLNISLTMLRLLTA